MELLQYQQIEPVSTPPFNQTASSIESAEVVGSEDEGKVGSGVAEAEAQKDKHDEGTSKVVSEPKKVMVANGQEFSYF